MIDETSNINTNIAYEKYIAADEKHNSADEALMVQ